MKFLNSLTFEQFDEFTLLNVDNKPNEDSSKEDETKISNPIILMPCWASNFVLKLKHWIGPIGDINDYGILYIKQPDKNNIFNLLNILGFNSITLGLMFILIVILILLNLIFTKQNSYYKNFKQFLSLFFYYMMSLVTTLPRKVFSNSKTQLLSMSWLLGIIFLTRLFTSELLSVMSNGHKFNSINSVEQLCITSNLQVKVGGFDESQIELLSKGILKCLKNRLTIFEAIDFAYKDREIEMFNDIHQGKYALLGEDMFFRERATKYKKLFPNLYLSQAKNWSQPYFVKFTNSNYNKTILNEFNRIIKELNENGIFDYWMKYSRMIIEDYHNNKKYRLIDQISYSALNIEKFVKIISVGIAMVLGFVCLFFEMLYYKYKTLCNAKKLCNKRRSYVLSYKKVI